MKPASALALLALASVVVTAFARAATPAHATTGVWRDAALLSLRQVAEMAPREGLAPEAEALALLQQLQAHAGADPSAATRLDAAADALFDKLARSFASGAVPPSAVDPDWRIPTQHADLIGLRAALRAGASPADLLLPLLPTSAEYAALRAELAQTYASDALALDALAPDAAGPDRATRVARLRANLERWRWLPRTFAERRIEVRIPQFQTALYRPGQNTVAHDAIVGRAQSPTPSLISEIRSVTLNPAWDPPPSIAAGLLSRFRANPQAAQRERFVVVTGEGRVVSAAAVNWRARPFPYRLRQRPGPANALGVVRFNVPNPYAIYLHDTPSRSLFAQDARALSHGCVRVSDPLVLTEAILDDLTWSEETLQTAVNERTTRSIALAAPIPVYLLYLTATIDATGAVVYADDIYDRDGPLVAALDQSQVGRVAKRENIPAS